MEEILVKFNVGICERQSHRPRERRNWRNREKRVLERVTELAVQRATLRHQGADF